MAALRSPNGKDVSRHSMSHQADGPLGLQAHVYDVYYIPFACSHCHANARLMWSMLHLHAIMRLQGAAFQMLKFVAVKHALCCPGRGRLSRVLFICISFIDGGLNDVLAHCYPCSWQSSGARLGMFQSSWQECLDKHCQT